MTAVAVELLPDPPAPQDAPDPDAVTLVADTDKLMTMCSCAADALTLAGGSLAHTARAWAQHRSIRVLPGDLQGLLARGDGRVRPPPPRTTS